MRFAAGLTLSGIVGFVFLEILKLLLPTLAAWTLGLLAIVVKVVLGAVLLVFALALIALVVFLYRRSETVRAEG